VVAIEPEPSFALPQKRPFHEERCGSMALAIPSNGRKAFLRYVLGPIQTPTFAVHNSRQFLSFAEYVAVPPVPWIDSRAPATSGGIHHENVG
jgi:hypothetical protein